MGLRGSLPPQPMLRACLAQIGFPPTSNVGHKLMLVGRLKLRLPSGAPARSYYTAGGSPLRKTANELELVSDIQNRIKGRKIFLVYRLNHIRNVPGSENVAGENTCNGEAG